MAEKPAEAGVPRHWLRIAGLLDRHGVNRVLDVGANTGQYAGWLRKAGWRGPIVSFEPASAAHAELVRAAATDPDWTVAQRMALGRAESEATLHVSNESDMSSLLPMRDDFLATSPTSREIATETVRVRSLDSVFPEYADERDRVLLKIDTQGSEAAVLDGARKTLPRLAGIQIELSLVCLYEGESGWRAMLDRLSDVGFEPHLVIPGYWSRHLGRMLQFDAVLFRSEGT